MGTAQFIKQISGWNGDARLYELSEPLKDEYSDNEFNHVIVSATTVMFTGPETYIFGADKDGNVVDWGELDGSYRGGLDHETALRGAGYEPVAP